jgi:phytoene dehydrogenase-like protein
VLEQGDRPGGAVHSREGPLPGFIEDPCAGYFPLTRASPAFAKIGLERFGVEWIDTPVVMVHPFPDGRAITLHRDLEPTVASLEAVRPGTGRAWADLVEPLLRAERMVRRVALSPLPPVAPALALALRLRRSGTSSPGCWRDPSRRSDSGRSEATRQRRGWPAPPCIRTSPPTPPAGSASSFTCSATWWAGRSLAAAQGGSPTPWYGGSRRPAARCAAAAPSSASTATVVGPAASTWRTAHACPPTPSSRA